MGNCQAAEAATVIIQHPGNKIERIYWSVSAHQVMNSNPGFYVALVTSTLKTDQNGLPLKQLKLLRPDDTLLIGNVYRLISFEDVLTQFASKKCVKLGKLLKERGGLCPNPNPNPNPVSVNKSENFNSHVKPVEQEANRSGNNGGASTSGGGRGGGGRHYGGGGSQWKPALQSISEIGS